MPKFFLPEQISLTDDHIKYNCARIKDLLGANNAMAKHYVDYPNDLLKHLRGEHLKSQTIPKNIPDSKEQTLVATQDIKAGTVIGMYYGEIIEERVKYSERDWDLMNEMKISAETIPIIGKLDNKTTLVATMNHASLVADRDQQYVFLDQQTRQQAASANVNETFFKMNYRGQEKIVFPLIVIKDIKKGEALLWPYVELKKDVAGFSVQTDQSNYFERAALTPLLFTKNGDLFPKDRYFPKQFNLNVNGHPVQVSYKWAPAIMSYDKEEQKVLCAEWERCLPNIPFDLGALRRGISMTGFTAPAVLQAMRTKAKQEVCHRFSGYMAKLGFLAAVGVAAVATGVSYFANRRLTM